MSIAVRCRHGLLLVLGLGMTVGVEAAPPKSRITYDRHALIIDGKPTMIWAGEFHPFRLPSPSLWRDILQKMKASGFNAVTFYFDWGYHTAKQGEYDFTGVRDVGRALDMAKEAGLYVIARTGPYVNAELARGGFPGWLTRQKAMARTDDPEYLAAVDEWMSRIDPIVAARQLDTGHGSVILFQIENELSVTGPSQANYMRHLYDKARADGISVPIFHNDPGRQGRWVPAGSGVPGTVEGPNDLYAFDGYPGTNCDVHARPTAGGAGPDWGLYGPGGAKGGASASPRTPGFLAEFGGGWFDYWGSNGTYDCTAAQKGTAYQRVFYGGNIANGLTLQSFYMTYGGTSWGWLPAPVVYTSYDYGAAIAEDRTLRAKALGLKQLGQFVGAVPDLARLDRGPPVTVSSPAVQVRSDIAADTHAQLLFVTHSPSNLRSDDTATVSGDLPDGHYSFPVRLAGYDAKLLLAGFNLERQRLVYSTSELQTSLRRGDEDIALFFGRADEAGETVLRLAHAPRVVVLEGDVQSRWDAVHHDLHLSYTHRGIARVRVDGGGAPPLLLLLAEEKAAQSFFRQDGPQGAALERGPTLVRTSTTAAGTLALTGDTAAAEPLELWAPTAVRRVTWNGAAVPVSRTASGSLLAARPLAGPRSFTLPDLTRSDWRYAEDIPETRPDFDDSHWARAQDAPDRSTIKAPEGQPTLQMDAYGFHQGDVWYRGRFDGSADARTLTIHYGGGGAGMLQLWIDGRFIGQNELPAGIARPQTTGIVDFALPADAMQGTHLIALMVRNNGNNWDLVSDDAHKEPRGLISASLSRPGGMSFAVPIRWTIQGTSGGETLADTARGPINNGGLHGEREGWHLPGFPDTRWTARRVPDATPVTGTAWYRTHFDLAVPKGDDATIGVQIGDPAQPRSPGRYRVLIFVNGWNMGQFIANVGPQRVFPIPEGILDHHGPNTLALAVTSDGQAGDGLEAVKLVTMRQVRGGVTVEPVRAPDWAALHK